MKAILTHGSTNYLMTPDQATEVLTLMLRYGTEVWVTDYEKQADTGKYVDVAKVRPASHTASDMRLLELRLVPDEMYGVAKMRHLAQEDK
jgi:hypothetical protein